MIAMAVRKSIPVLGLLALLSVAASACKDTGGDQAARTGGGKGGGGKGGRGGRPFPGAAARPATLRRCASSAGARWRMR